MRRAFEQAIRAMTRESQGDPVDEVLLIGKYPETEIAIVFHLPSRPGCQFGYSWGPFWGEVEADVQAGRAKDWTDVTPDGWGAFTVAVVNCVEAMSEPPMDCESEGITWYVQRCNNLREVARRARLVVVAPRWLPAQTELSYAFLARGTPNHPEYVGIRYRHAQVAHETILHESADRSRSNQGWIAGPNAPTAGLERLPDSTGPTRWRTVWVSAESRTEIFIFSDLDEETIVRMVRSLQAEPRNP